MDPTARLHGLFMELVRAGGFLQPEYAIPGQQISMSQVFALHELDTDTPLSQRELAERLQLEKSSVSRLAAEMERKGLLERERDPANRRLYRLRLTDHGREAHKAMGAAFHDTYVCWVEAMTPTERECLLVGLSAFIRAMRAHPVVWGHRHA